MKIITAIGEPKINEELKKDKFYEIIGVDIQYQDGIFEILEKNKNINYLILNLSLVGDLNKYELIEKILEENKKLKLIVILEKENEKIINYLFSKNIKNILIKNKNNLNEINNIIKNKKEINLINDENKIINNKNNTKKNNKKIKNNIKKNKSIKIKKFPTRELIKNNFIKKLLNKNIKKINNKKLLILGDKKVGKTIFIILFSKIINKKILIIDILNEKKEINIMFGIKSSGEEEILKINKNIDLIKCNIESLERTDVKNKFQEYDYILFDSSNIKEKNEINKLTKITDEIILIIEPNIIGINNSKKIIDIILEEKNINKNNIKIIINKNNYFSINKKLIKNIFSEFKIIGQINQNNKYNFLINNNFNLIDLKIKKEFIKIIKGVENL